MIRINLIPVRVTKKELAIRNQAAVAGFVLLLAIGSVGYLQIDISGKISEMEGNITDTQNKLKQLETTVKKIEQFKAQKADLEKKLDVIAKLVAGRSGPIFLMLELSLSSPEKLWLNKLAIKGSNMELVGIADTEKTVIDFSQNLKQQKHISDVQLQELQGGKKNAPQGTLLEFVEFKLLAGIRSGGDGAAPAAQPRP